MAWAGGAGQGPGPEPPNRIPQNDREPYVARCTNQPSKGSQATTCVIQNIQREPGGDALQHLHLQESNASTSTQVKATGQEFRNLQSTNRIDSRRPKSTVACTHITPTTRTIARTRRASIQGLQRKLFITLFVCLNSIAEIHLMVVTHRPHECNNAI